MVFRKTFSESDKLPAELESLFAAYRTALPEVDASPDFMPRLWERIDGRQRVTYSFSRLARGIVTVAAGLCLFLSSSMWSTPQISTSKAGTYVDVLADDSSDDSPDSIAI